MARKGGGKCTGRNRPIPGQSKYAAHGHRDILERPIPVSGIAKAAKGGTDNQSMQTRHPLR